MALVLKLLGSEGSVEPHGKQILTDNFFCSGDQLVNVPFNANHPPIQKHIPGWVRCQPHQVSTSQREVVPIEAGRPQARRDYVSVVHAGVNRDCENCAWIRGGNSLSVLYHGQLAPSVSRQFGPGAPGSSARYIDYCSWSSCRGPLDCSLEVLLGHHVGAFDIDFLEFDISPRIFEEILWETQINHLRSF